MLNKTVIYSYDAGGNIKSKLEIPYGGAPRTTTTYGYDSVWKDKLINYNGKAITYDEIGNPKTYDGYTYTWEEGRRLKSIAGNNKNITFKYNDAGIRTEKSVGGVVTKYHLIDDRVTYEYTKTADGVVADRIYYRYDNADDLVSMNLNGVEYYYIRNGQGDIIGIIDNTGTKVVSYVYDNWGKLISIKDVNGIDVTNNVNHVGYKNPYRYRGYRYDSETEWYYLNSRYYNPEWGRFINADGLVGELGNLLGHNMFSYCKNNHVNIKDPSGCWPTWSNIVNADKKLVNSSVKAVKETMVKISFVATTIVIFAAKNPDIAQAIILPAASRGLKRTSKSFSKSFPSKKAALRYAGIGKHGQSTQINDIYLNEGSRHPFKGTKQIRQGWAGEKGHEVFYDEWGHKEEPFDMSHFNVYFKDERTGHYYYPSSWDPNNNR